MKHLFFWRGQRQSGKWTATLKAIVEAWREGRETTLVTRLDASHFFQTVYWFINEP